MQTFPFTQLVDRTGTGSLKGNMTPQKIRDAGLVSYWGAEFDFPTCPAFSEGVRACAERGLYAFTPQGKDYNDRIAWWMKNMRDWEVEPEWIVPTHGTIFALASAIRLFVGEGQNLLVILPGYSRYKQAADRLGRGCTASYMRYENGHYALDYADLEEKLSRPENALLVFSNPNNPTGHILSEKDLRRIDELSRKYQVPVFCDEIFADVTLDGSTVTPYGKAAKPDSPAITCSSFGKCMSLTGINHANVFLPNEALRKLYIRQKYADHYGSIDPLLYAGLLRACTEEGRDYVLSLREVIAANRQLLTTRLTNLLPGTYIVPAAATYLLWVDYRGLGLEDAALKNLLDKTLFSGDPGSEYGVSDQFCRYSIAAPTWAIQKSMNVLEKVLKEEGR